MSIKNIPYFEINGKRYEIKKNRYLQAEFDEMKRNNALNEDEELEYVKEQELSDKLEKLAKRKNELYDKFLETFDDEDERIYNKACVAYNVLLDQLNQSKGITSKKRKQMFDMGEALIIKALQTNDKGETIRSENEAKLIWNDFVIEFGEMTKIEFIVYTINYIIGNDEEDENPFIAQAKAKAEQKANMKKGIGKVK